MHTFKDMKFLFGFKDEPYYDNRDRGILRMNYDESELLWNSIKDTDGRILEIGRCHGGSTVLIVAAAGPDREVISVDIAPDHMQIAIDYFADKEFSKSLTLIEDDSAKIKTENLGLLFVDGDHSYEGVSKDIQHHWPALDINGLCVFHDAIPNDGLKHMGEDNHCEGVTKVCQELLESGKGKEVAKAGSVLVLRKLM